ncbi:MAG: ABC transporter substrate-binding protein [Alkalispirochaeta sp.]
MNIDESTTLYDLTEAYPRAISILVAAGFRRMDDPALRRQFGSSITIEAAALARGYDPAEFLTDLRAKLSSPQETRERGPAGREPGAAGTPVRIMGLVPCPIRVPMTQVMESASQSFTADTGIDVEFDLQAAYTGTEWMEENLGAHPTAQDLPEVFLSAGFRLFFTDDRFRRLRREGAFRDRTGWDQMNGFARANDLQDPERRFSVVGVVPAVFMVNRTLLGDRKVPQSWAEVLTPEYENSLALPVGDFDLFDALLLGVHRSFGMAGVEQLARNMFQQMHPAQMVAGAGGAAGASDAGSSSGAGGPSGPGRQPLITIMPYFFTRTITESSPLIPVWPEDGALAAPILLVTRSDRPEIQPLIDTIAGESMSRVLSKLGLFPSTHPDNDDFSPEEHPLQWPGWDQLLSDDLPVTLQRTTETFEGIVAARHQAVTV